ncbi:leucine-rich repeat-containing protein 15-like [Amia ocellicauda]|uniref:leucine-rich repeat-containing protein 15-like n=1 Tax=Amia ocellicauda TaxID=2972642 RepID=UPI00346426E3
MIFYFWFLFHVSVSWAKLAPQEGLEKVYKNLEELKFVNSSAALSHIPSKIPSFTEQFDLSRNHLMVIPKGAFTALHRLRVLLMNDNNISSIEDGAFSFLESLHRLDLSCNKISALSDGFFRGLGSLRDLLLSENQLMALPSRSLQHLDNLQKLILSRNDIGFIEIRAFGHLTQLRQLHLDKNKLTILGYSIFSMLKSLEILSLQENQINGTEVGVFTPLTSLVVLNMTNNLLETIQFKTFLSIHTYGTHILLAQNRWHCDCDLQRVFRKLQSVQRLILDDYSHLTCQEPPELHGRRLEEVDNQLCIRETVTVLVITLTVVITVVVAIVMAERNGKKITGKHWSEESNLSYDSQDQLTHRPLRRHYGLSG